MVSPLFNLIINRNVRWAIVDAFELFDKQHPSTQPFPATLMEKALTKTLYIVLSNKQQTDTGLLVETHTVSQVRHIYSCFWFEIS